MPVLLLVAAIMFSEMKVRPRDVPEEPATRVIQTKAAWRAFVSGDPPAVDFSRETVVAIFAGERPTAGYSVKVRTAETRNRNATVTYRVEKPRPDAMVAQMISYPYTVVRLKGRFNRIKFQQE